MRYRGTSSADDRQPSSFDSKVLKKLTSERTIAEGYEKTHFMACMEALAFAKETSIESQTAIKTDVNEVYTMQREPVVSSNIRSIGYEDETQTLEIEFMNSWIYQYYNVREIIYSEMMKADSKGKFLHYYIKNRYPYSRVG